MRNALPDVQGYEKNEKTDIALRPEQVSVVMGKQCPFELLKNYISS